MDDFAVDLDKVLDDFELSEGGSSATKAESKLNHAANLPGLQMPVSGGSHYTVSPVAPLQPAYPPNNANNTNYRPQPGFNAQFDITYQPVPHHLSDYAIHNPVIHATVQEAEGHGDVIPNSKSTISNNPLDLTSNMERLTQTSIPHMEQLHSNDPTTNQQWSNAVINNNMTPYAIKYGMEGGVLAHGERSNGTHLRRLNNDRPELLQSMQQKPSPLPPYPGEVPTSQPYPGGPVVSHTRPDVVPVSLNNGMDVRPTNMQVKTDTGVESYSPLNMTRNFTPASTQCLSNIEQQQQQQQLALLQQQTPVTPTQFNTNIPTVACEEPQENIHEDMNVDTPPQSLQLEPSNTMADQTIDPLPTFPTHSEMAEPVERQSVSTPTSSAVDCGNSASEDVKPDVTTQVDCQKSQVAPQEVRADPAPVGFCNTQQEPQPVGFSNTPEPQPVGVGVSQPEPQPVGFSNTKPELRPLGFSNIQRLPQPQSRPVGFGNTQPEPRPVGFGNTQPEPRPVGFGNAQPESRPVGFGNTQPEPRPVGFGNAQPESRPVGFGTTQPEPRPVGFGNTQPEPRPVGFGNAQPKPRPVGFGNAQSEGPVSFGNTQPEGPVGFGSTQSEGPVGFGDMQTDDITEDDMDAYLADLEAPETATGDPFSNCPIAAPIDNNSSYEPNMPDIQKDYSRSDSQGSTGVVEKFLAPSIVTPRISTPMEDPGFSKVPGYIPCATMACLEEGEQEEEETPTGAARNSITTDGQDQNVHSVLSSLAQPVAVVSADDSQHSKKNISTTSVKEAKVPTDRALPEIGGDCVMTMEKGKSEQTETSTLGAITVSFPVHPKDTTSISSETTSDMGSQQVGTGARPKETANQNTQRKSRPNSLLGLSKPDLNITVPVSSSDENQDSGYGGEVGTSMPSAAADSCLDHAGSPTTGSMVENSHDIINRHLAQKARSPLQKKQLNLEIKQRQFEVKSLENRSTEENPSPMLGDAAISVVTNRAQLASGIGLTLPSDPNHMVRTDSGIQDDILSSSSSSSLLSIQAPSPARLISAPLAAVDSGPEQQQQYQPQEPTDQLQDLCDGAEGEGASDVPKLRRPTSLSLLPRNDFSLNQDKDSTDDSVTGDGGYASSASSGGHLTPFQGDNEMSEPAGAMASGAAVDMLYSPPEVGPGAFSPTPRCSSNVNVVITQLGKVAPRWVPDAEACNCMECEARFTFTKRRHHCRACGKVFCSACCNLKCKLQYMDNKEARVCSKCYQDIVRAQAYERMHSPNRSPNPNNPAEYCSTIPPHQQAAASLHAPPPTVMVPVGVLRKEGSQRSGEPKQVMFSDGIRPGGDLTELDGSEARVPLRRHSRSSKKVERLAAAAANAEGSSEASAKSPSPKTRVKRLSEPSLRHACLIPDVGLPPVIMSTGVKGDFTLEEDPNHEVIMPKIRSTEDPNPVVFAINKNLFVLVKIVNLDCCLNRVCWCFSTKGMCTVGQDEVVIVLECLPDEKTIPRDIFCHLNSVYDEASKGNTVSHLGHTIFGQSFLDSRDHCGFLYVRPTFQCVQKLLLPQPPYVFGLLLQKWETPWAKVFPVRLMLRLGAEYRYYPCPLISVRFRKPVYGEIGHTIMNLLADFRNYQYMLPQTRGVVVHMEEKKTFIKFPRNRYEEVMKVITNSNDHVMALGANFSTDADSHLVCIQNEDGNYQTQAINIQNKPRKVTGASFVVFNGALKTSSGLRAKSSIVEDGLMVQITSEAMGQLKAALLDMKDYTISCGPIDAPTPEEQVIIQWVEDDRKVNQGVKSPIDGLPMDGIESVHIHNGTDYVGETRTIRWTEVFFIQNEDSSNSRGDPVDLSRLAETLAQACCIALTPHLDKLRESGLTKLGLRCTIDRDNVGYEVGANGEKLADNYMNDLDNELIPVIHNAGSQNQDGPVVLELVFYIIE